MQYPQTQVCTGHNLLMQNWIKSNQIQLMFQFRKSVACKACVCNQKLGNNQVMQKKGRWILTVNFYPPGSLSLKINPLACKATAGKKTLYLNICWFRPGCALGSGGFVQTVARHWFQPPQWTNLPSTCSYSPPVKLTIFINHRIKIILGAIHEGRYLYFSLTVVSEKPE